MCSLYVGYVYARSYHKDALLVRVDHHLRNSVLHKGLTSLQVEELMTEAAHQVEFDPDVRPATHGISNGDSGGSSFSDLVACQRPCRLSTFLLCRNSGSNSGSSMGDSGNDIVRGSSSLASRNTAVVPAAVPVET
jgi:hypothetical protein